MSLFLASNYISGTPNFGHLQLVFGENPETGVEIEVQAPVDFWAVGAMFGLGPGLLYAFGEWTFPELDPNDPRLHSSNTPHIGESPKSYAASAIDWTPIDPWQPGGDRTDADIWSIWQQAHVQFATQTHIHYGLLQNSNSYVTTLLALTGFDVQDLVADVTPTEVSWFPGIGVDVLADPDLAPNLQLAGGEHGDVIHGGAGDDVILGHDGDDHIGDGDGADVLGGGAGDDTFALGLWNDETEAFDDDGEGDIIIVGEGHDTIFGGDANDLLVVGLDQLGLQLPYNSAVAAPGMGAAAATLAIPLLGGFYNHNNPNNAYHVMAPVAVGTEMFEDSEMQLTFPVWTSTPQPALWDELVATDAVYGGEIPVISISYSFAGENLDISIAYIATDPVTGLAHWTHGSVTIVDYQPGDFGMQFAAESPYDYTVPDQSIFYDPDEPPSYFPSDWAFANQINNYGDYIEIPASFTAEDVLGGATGGSNGNGDGIVVIDAGGEWALRGPVPDGVEGILITNPDGTVMHFSDPAQWELIKGAYGSHDVIDMGFWTPSTGLLVPVVTALVNAGVESVTWQANSWSVAASGNGDGSFSVTSTDTAGVSQSASVTSTYSDDGLLLSRHYVFDDGTELEQSFADGVLVSALLTDPLNMKIWTSISVQYGPDGLIGSREITYDDGGSLQQLYQLANGTFMFTDASDPGDAHPWKFLRVERDSAGIETMRMVEYDDGTQVQIVFDNGVLAQSTIRDLGDLHDWQNFFAQYDSNGLVSYKQILWDNGTFTERFFNSGVLTSASVADNGNLHNWDTSVTHFNSAGAITDKTVTYDNGVVLSQSYSGGVLQSAMQQDAADAFAWDTVGIAYAADGSIDLKAVTYDDGHLAVIGGAGSQMIAGGATNDMLTGGAGGDVFVFAPGGGNDAIKDFADGEDLIDLTAFGVASVAGFSAAGYTAIQSGAHAVLHMGEHTLTLLNTDLSHLGDADLAGFATV